MMERKKFKIFEIIFLYSVKTAEIMIYNIFERRIGYDRWFIAV